MPTAIAGPLELAVVDLVNAERAQAGLDPVHVEVNLTESARDHAGWIADAGRLDHTGAGGSSVGDRVADTDFAMEGESWRVTENLAYRGIDGAPDAGDAAALHAALMDSASHRANILDGDVDYLGVGLAIGQVEGQDALFLTQNFGRTTGEATVQEEVDGETVLTTFEDGVPVGDSTRPAPETEDGTDTGTGPGTGTGDDGTGEDRPGDDDGDEEDPQDESRASGGGCFVATAAYGDRRHADVAALRRLRDEVLVRHPAGRGAVRLYWRVGPVLARRVRADRASGRISRWLLVPAVAVARRLTGGG